MRKTLHYLPAHNLRLFGDGLNISFFTPYLSKMKTRTVKTRKPMYANESIDIFYPF